jgi:hypothetical protein
MAGDLKKRGLSTLGDQRWRLNNLYKILDKTGKKITFKMNRAQSDLYDSMWYCNVILKARQLGYTSFIQLFLLDMALFRSNVKCGVIAHNLKDAQSLFVDKLKFPYDNLPASIKTARPLVRDSASELAFSNGSSIRVGTSMRSGTLNFLHISELGKISAKYPEKAREIRTGALNTVQSGQMIFIESTAEGQEGDFYNICETARAAQRRCDKLSQMDFKFHFAPWFAEPSYRIDPSGVEISAEMAKYFADLRDRHDIVLDDEQRAWYVKKAATQLEDMKREYPSTPDESFEASVEGAYYGAWIESAEVQGRIGEVEAHPDYPIHTAWDIGVGDSTAIWMVQFLPKEIRVLGYVEAAGEGLPFYVDLVKSWYTGKGWHRDGAIDFVPHDIKVREWGTKKTRIEQMIEHGFNPKVAKQLSVDDGINAVRVILPMCRFDAPGTAGGIRCLKNYKKTWNADTGCWSNAPYHNFASHGADAFRYLAAAHKEVAGQVAEVKKPTGLTFNDLVQMDEAAQSASRMRR